MTKAAVSANEPNEFYDSLPESAQSLWDKIGSLGYRIEHSNEGYTATKTADPTEFFGPAEHLSDLYDDVIAAEGGEIVEDESSTEVELDEDHKGNTYLPGAKPVVDRQLADAAGKYFADNTNWKDAGKKRTDSKSALDAIVATKRHLFHEDPDNTNSLIYKAGGLIIRIAKEQKTVVSVETEKQVKATA